MSAGLQDMELLRCFRAAVHPTIKEKVATTTQAFGSNKYAIVPISRIMDVVHQDAAWHMKQHHSLAKFDIDKILG